jgi:hypothetical protein
MSKLKWDQAGERFYETGAKKAVLYVDDDKGVAYGKGVAWNGLTAFTESPSGAEATPLYADDIKYLELMSNEEFGGTIEAYTYPDEFGACNGEAELAAGVKIGQQVRKTFGFSYVTTIGNDTKGNDYGYKIHLVYGAKAAPSEKAYTSINDAPEAMTLSWEITTTPIEVEGFKPTAHIEIDSTKIDADKLKAIEAILYGTDGEGSGEGTVAKLPTPAELIAILKPAE